MSELHLNTKSVVDICMESSFSAVRLQLLIELWPICKFIYVSDKAIYNSYFPQYMLSSH